MTAPPCRSDLTAPSKFNPPVYTTTRWTFSVPGIEGREVQPTLETLYRRLAETTLPTAERLLSNEPP